MLAGLELLIALIIVALGATVMGTVSFGMGLVVAPVLLLFLAPQSVVVTVNAIILLTVLFILTTTWRHLSLSQMWRMVLGGLVAPPVGVLLLSSANPTALRITIALVILLLGGLSLFNVQLPLARRPATGFIVGFLTALSITTLSIGGPLAAIYVMAQGWPREQMRASLAFFFATSYSIAFALYAYVGLIDRDTLVNIGLLVPALLAGFGLATLLVRRMNEGVFRYAAIGVIITGSLVLLAREVFG